MDISFFEFISVAQPQDMDASLVEFHLYQQMRRDNPELTISEFVRLLNENPIFVIDSFIDNIITDQVMSRSMNDSQLQENNDILPDIDMVLCGTGYECSICIDRILPELLVYDLECKHYFHPECLSKWITLRQVCPNCKREIPHKEIKN